MSKVMSVSGKKVKAENGKVFAPVDKPRFATAVFRIVGTSDLLVHNFSQKSRQAIKDKQMQSAIGRRRVARDPQAEFEASMYRGSKGEHLFPSSAFGRAVVDACRTFDTKALSMTKARQLFWCLNEFVEIELSGEPFLDERMVRIGNGVSDIRYRARYPQGWSAEVEFRYNAGATSVEQLATLMVIAGESIGIGEYRVQKGGYFGTFKLV